MKDQAIGQVDTQFGFFQKKVGHYLLDLLVNKKNNMKTSLVRKYI